MKEQLSLSEAKRLSILKWEAHVKAGGYCPDLPSELDNLLARCGFCERYLKYEATNEECVRCEFGKLAGICFNEGSLWYMWNKDLETAQKILDIINSIEP